MFIYSYLGTSLTILLTINIYFEYYAANTTFCLMTFLRSSSMGCTPKDSISAPPVEGLYDARCSDFANSPFSREQVRRNFFIGDFSFLQGDMYRTKWINILALTHVNVMYNGISICYMLSTLFVTSLDMIC